MTSIPFVQVPIRSSRRLLCVRRQQACSSMLIPCATSFTWIKFKRWQDAVRAKEDWDFEKKVTRVYVGNNMYIPAEDPGATYRSTKHPDDWTRRDKGQISMDYMAFQTGLRYIDLSTPQIKRYMRYQNMLQRQYDQRFIAERLLVLGPDLAAAHFLVHRGAAVKFVDDDTWYKRDRFMRYSLPDYNVPGLHLEAIDASNTELMWEGFDNMMNLAKLRMLRLADCPYIDDWCLSKFSQFCDSLELLDLSGCNKISAKGLTALAHLQKLRAVRLENLESVRNLAKVALMLEDAIPGVHVTGVDYDSAAEQLETEHRLASHRRVVEDAKGNLFVYDDAGRLYCVGGESMDNLNQRPVVDNVDRPVFQSVVRPDVPLLSLDELVELDRLSRLRLRRYLLGSPSSVHWGEDAERIVSFNANRSLKKGAEVHPFMLPVEKRRELFAKKGIEHDPDELRSIRADDSKIAANKKRLALTGGGDRPTVKPSSPPAALAAKARGIVHRALKAILPVKPTTSQR